MKLFRKIRKKWPALCLMVKACWLNVVIKEKREFDSNSQVHISLTSYGNRLHTVFMTIEMLFKQTASINSITLYISNQDMRRENLPSTLKRLEQRGLTIRFVDENIRSYKKIYYSYLEHYQTKEQKAMLVTADDDVLYSSNWLAELMDAFVIHPNTVVAHRCHTITLNKEGKPKPYKQWNGKHDDQLAPISDNLLMPTGIGGVLYPIASLAGLELQKDAFLEKCGSADDIWLKCLTYHNGYYSKQAKPKKIVTYPGTLSLTTKRRGLALYNVHQGGNDIQMKKTIDFFNISFTDNV